MENRIFNLDAEELCGHYVSKDVKKLWSIQLDLLNKLKVICGKHNIKYMAAGGTLLGAIRHKGYIPWDDDIDVYMLPDDYERFCEIAKKELEEPYFFQHYTTEQEFSSVLARIRRSDTMAMTQHEYDTVSEGYNCGIFLDIFPLQYVYKNTLLRLIHKLICFVISMGIAGYKRNLMIRKHGFVHNRKYISHILILYWKLLSCFMNFEDLARYYIKVCSFCSYSDEVGLIAFFGFKKKYIWKTKWWNDIIDLPFENTTIKVPKGYDEILKNQFGNYMVFEKGTAIHTMRCFDTEVSYKEKLFL